MKRKSKQRQPKAFLHSDYLSLISKTKNRGKRSSLIDFANKQQLEAIAECIENVLRGNVPLTNTQSKRLAKHKKSMRIISDRKASLPKKKRVLKQEGGFLGTLIPLAISALGSLIGGLNN